MEKHLSKAASRRRTQLAESRAQIAFQSQTNAIVHKVAARAIAKRQVTVDLLMAYVEESFSHLQLDLQAESRPAGRSEELECRDPRIPAESVEMVAVAILLVLLSLVGRSKLPIVTTHGAWQKRIAPYTVQIWAADIACLVHCDALGLVFPGLEVILA